MDAVPGGTRSNFWAVTPGPPKNDPGAGAGIVEVLEGGVLLAGDRQGHAGRGNVFLAADGLGGVVVGVVLGGLIGAGSGRNRGILGGDLGARVCASAYAAQGRRLGLGDAAAPRKRCLLPGRPGCCAAARRSRRAAAFGRIIALLGRLLAGGLAFVGALVGGFVALRRRSPRRRARAPEAKAAARVRKVAALAARSLIMVVPSGWHRGTNDGAVNAGNAVPDGTRR